MIATSKECLPDVAKIVQAAGIGCHKQETPLPQWEDGILVIDAHGGSVAVSLMPAPIPWSDLEGPCATAWWWKEATAVMQGHKFHFLVVFTGGAMEAVERRIILTNVVREVLLGADCVGVYWAEGTLVRQPDAFLELTEGVSNSTVQAMAWIDIRVQLIGGGVCRCFTTGLAQLGFLEIEIERSTLPPDEIFLFVDAIASYIINGRKRIKHGETMGRSATEQYKVRHAPSMLGRGEVMYLEML